MIQIEHVSKTFSGKYGTVHALDDVSIHVEKGDICGIIGFSGAGKSCKDHQLVTRNRQVNVLEVMFLCTLDDDLILSQFFIPPAAQRYLL